ncbi:lipoyl(octanoyl) transferase LipB [Prolixibacter sp. NT017]|uniref:lipoyl(octanoyl) transferase LipB n=1 Tax=Prolixibacter sp. NT017 TaxID=2652390 RepID=UPI00127503BD|nr:lipoyl(octanoyl) transferase LipB [Prolixibacter sp. NT017]GET27071.1 octanoyltransferase [Prolixibacter sp. NT017]
MNHKVQYLDFGVAEYKYTWDRQEELMGATIQMKLDNKNAEPSSRKETPNYLIFVEHPHVYTLGKSGDEHNLLLNYIQLQAEDATFFRTNRGGDITYHGPGQIVGYPIIDLENFDIGLRQYIYNLEETIIKTIAEFGLEGSRDESATGVWLDVGKPTARKICAIGVKSSRHVTMHGFAFNVNTNLNYFQHINPCGFVDKGVTSLQKELGKEQDFEAIKALTRQKFAEVFGAELV